MILSLFLSFIALVPLSSCLSIPPATTGIGVSSYPSHDTKTQSHLYQRGLGIASGVLGIVQQSLQLGQTAADLHRSAAPAQSDPPPQSRPIRLKRKRKQEDEDTAPKKDSDSSSSDSDRQSSYREKRLRDDESGGRQPSSHLTSPSASTSGSPASATSYVMIPVTDPQTGNMMMIPVPYPNPTPSSRLRDDTDENSSRHHRHHRRE